MYSFISSFLFDLMNLIGVIMSVWPIVSMKHKDVALANTVGRLANKDKEEIIPQIKWSLTGLVFLILTFIGKTVISFIVDMLNTGYPRMFLLTLAVVVVVCLTVLFRILLIDKYWRKYDWKKVMGKPYQQ